MSDVEHLNNSVKALFNKLKPLLDTESKTAISNYLAHFECEMAFEALFLELKSLDYLPDNLNKQAIIQLGLELKLDSEDNHVLVNDFWTVFMEFLSIKPIDQH